ncbi:MAG: hypothetical protein M1826_005513 [Phylliscum demangeonii]|nr:MAG: hypothetical protein M1826_005513 [Phylliscum demangeonii]
MQLLSTFFRSQWTEDRLGRLMRGDFEYENVQFGRFLLAYGDATLQDLARKCEDDQSKYILTILHGLLRCKGVAVVDDEICTNALEFWTAFVEFMVDSTYAGDQEEAWFQPARAHVVETFQDCLVKIRVPDPSIVAAWDSDFRTGFKDFRKDSADLVEASYPILGAEIFIEVVELVLAALERKEWQEVEAALFCLNALSDCYSGGPNEQAALESLFKSSIFSLREDGQAGVPAKARETLVALLGNYSSFFETRPDYLSPAMHFLFQCLEVPSSAISASKSIASLGSSCRHALSSNIDAFILYLENLLSQGSIDHIVKDKVFGAVASVIQALPTDEAKARCLQRLIYLVQQDVSICLRHVGAQEVSEAEEAGTTALQCLSSIGKGMRGFLEAAIDLTSDTPRGSLFWDQVEGATLQAQIVGLVDAICGSMPLNGAVIEAACSVFKSGLSETTPGPFVFPAHVTTGFLLKSQVSTPRVGLVVATACSLISSHSNEGSTRIDGEANALLAHFVGFIQQLGAPENDPDVAQNCIDFLTRLLSRYANVLVQFEPQSLLQEVLIFTLRCMAGVDILPKRASATFWASFIGIDPQPDVAQSAINNILEHLGSSVAEAIIINVGGHAARSDLDTVAEPLKRMVFHHVKAKTWLAQALFNPNFPSAKVNDEQKRLFLQQVML